jgi:hypothetical protein
MDPVCKDHDNENAENEVDETIESSGFKDIEEDGQLIFCFEAI